MERLDLTKYKIKEKTKKSKITRWQDYAIEVCQEFNVEGIYKMIIFKHAKKNLPYLQGKVTNVKEKFGEDISDKGRYLISLFRKKKPWE